MTNKSTCNCGELNWDLAASLIEAVIPRNKRVSFTTHEVEPSSDSEREQVSNHPPTDSNHGVSSQQVKEDEDSIGISSWPVVNKVITKQRSFDSEESQTVQVSGVAVDSEYSGSSSELDTRESTISSTVDWNFSDSVVSPPCSKPTDISAELVTFSLQSRSEISSLSCTGRKSCARASLTNPPPADLVIGDRKVENLFRGDFDNWRRIGGRHTFRALESDHQKIIAALGSDHLIAKGKLDSRNKLDTLIITKDHYRDFVLQVDFLAPWVETDEKIIYRYDQGYDGGILVRGHKTKIFTGGIIARGPLVNCPGGMTGLTLAGPGAILQCETHPYKCLSPSQSKSIQCSSSLKNHHVFNRWLRYKIVCRGPNINVWVDDEHVSSYQCEEKQGFIGLQARAGYTGEDIDNLVPERRGCRRHSVIGGTGSRVYYKNILLRKLN